MVSKINSADLTDEIMAKESILPVEDEDDIRGLLRYNLAKKGIGYRCGAGCAPYGRHCPGPGSGGHCPDDAF